MTTESLKFSYDVPRSDITKTGAVVAVLAFFFCYRASCHAGLGRYSLFAIAALLIGLYLLLVGKRLTGSHTLELTEGGIVLPRHGFRSGQIHVEFSNVIRLLETDIQGMTIFRVVSKDRELDINRSFFANNAIYTLVRNLICARSGINLSPDTPVILGWREAPPPPLHWTEAPDWPRYRASLVAANPPFRRVLKNLRFFLCCFAIIMVPRLLLHFSGLADPPFWGYFVGALALAAFLTFMYWHSKAYPARITEIVFRADHVTFFSGKQTANIKYENYLSWNIVERQFEGRPLLILLLKSNRWLRAHALARSEDRGLMTQILDSKKIPADPSLRPSWE